MNKKRWLILLLVPLTTGLVGCVQEVVRTVEVTRVVQETVIVPRVREVVVTATPKPPYTPALRACQPDNCEPYFAGAETLSDNILHSLIRAYLKRLTIYLASLNRTGKALRITLLDVKYTLEL